MKISVIVVSWNTKSLLRNCLKSLGEGLEIIVVDNGSTDGSAEMVKREFPSAILINNRKNLGFGAANNQGLKRAEGEYLLLLNSDTVVNNQAPLKMAQFLHQHKDAGVVGCRLLNPDKSYQPSAGPFPNLAVAAIMLFFEHWLGDLVRKSPDSQKEVDWVMGAAMMIRPEVIEGVGPMDEGIFMYMDEVEWCYRIKKAGYKVIFWPGAEIVHLGSGSSKTGRKDPILNIFRGLIYFYKKHYSGLSLLILIIMLKLKSILAMAIGRLTGNSFLTQTYAEAFEVTQG